MGHPLEPKDHRSQCGRRDLRVRGSKKSGQKIPFEQKQSVEGITVLRKSQIILWVSVSINLQPSSLCLDEWVTGIHPKNCRLFCLIHEKRSRKIADGFSSKPMKTNPSEDDLLDLLSRHFDRQSWNPMLKNNAQSNNSQLPSIILSWLCHRFTNWPTNFLAEIAPKVDRKLGSCKIRIHLVIWYKYLSLRRQSNTANI